METTTVFLKNIDKISDDDDYEGHIYVRRNGLYLNKYRTYDTISINIF